MNLATKDGLLEEAIEQLLLNYSDPGGSIAIFETISYLNVDRTPTEGDV